MPTQWHHSGTNYLVARITETDDEILCVVDAEEKEYKFSNLRGGLYEGEKREFQFVSTISAHGRCGCSTRLTQCRVHTRTIPRFNMARMDVASPVDLSG